MGRKLVKVATQDLVVTTLNKWSPSNFTKKNESRESLVESNLHTMMNIITARDMGLE
jgi:hypothetical protein